MSTFKFSPRPGAQGTVHLDKDTFLLLQSEARGGTAVARVPGSIVLLNPHSPLCWEDSGDQGDSRTCLSVPEEPKVWRMLLCRMLEMPSMLKRCGEETKKSSCFPLHGPLCPLLPHPPPRALCPLSTTRTPELPHCPGHCPECWD